MRCATFLMELNQTVKLGTGALSTTQQAKPALRVRGTNSEQEKISQVVVKTL